MNETKKDSILPKLLARQSKNSVKVPSRNSKIGFAFSTKNRVELSRRTLKTLDTEKGFDILWLDGSDTEEGKRFPSEYVFKKARLKDICFGVTGGPDRCIQFGLEKLLDMGYDYCGLIENDLLFKPGWFNALIKTYSYAAREGLVVGSATVRSYNSRVIEYRKNYSINWNTGAGMVLFSRKGAEIVLDNYPEDLKKRLPIITRKLIKFYGENFGIDISSNDEWKGAFEGHLIHEMRLGPDHTYEKALYEHGLSTIGSIPNFVIDTGVDVKRILHTRYVNRKDSGRGLIFPKMSSSYLAWVTLTEPILYPTIETLRRLGVLKYRKRLLFGEEKLISSYRVE